MELLGSILFLFFLLILLWELKADAFFIIFGLSVFIYILIRIFITDPFKIVFLMSWYIILNPWGLLIIIIPLLLYLVFKISKNKKFK